MCQKDHTNPKRMLAWSAPHRSCIGSMAYPDQPNSSPNAAMNATRDKANAVRTENCGSGTGTPIKRSAPYDKTATTGIVRINGVYQIFALIRL